MPLTAADLLEPAGELSAALFPGDDATALTTRLTGYLTDAYVRAPGNDDAVRAWAYHRAYRAVYVAMSRAASSASLSDQGSISYTAAQIQNFLDLSNGALADYETAITDTAATSTRGAWPAITSLRR